MKLRIVVIREMPTDTVAQLVRASVQQTAVLGSNPSECQILYLFLYVFHCYPDESLESPTSTGICIIQ